MIRIFYYGKLADIVGTAQEERTLPSGVSDSEQVRAWLVSTLAFGEALQDPVVRIAVNDALYPGAVPIRDGDEVAFLPPVGGG